ncbi:DUF1878 family protein [Bacillus massiliigorillae]|uniref:DUF1878 family protein n=1 Tax=Bacillus massiliigorillae TaxID=1243664 RepID=UPI0003A7A220|nr:DUF1878 family protein [Bacillus massiliigorillae]
MDDLQRRIETLEYHQQLLIRMLKFSNDQLYYLIILKNLSRQETEALLDVCESMSEKLQKQKAEGYVTFYPLLNELQAHLPNSISINELVQACLKQGVYVALMQNMKELLEEGDCFF